MKGKNGGTGPRSTIQIPDLIASANKRIKVVQILSHLQVCVSAFVSILSQIKMPVPKSLETAASA